MLNARKYTFPEKKIYVSTVALNNIIASLKGGDIPTKVAALLELKKCAKKGEDLKNALKMVSKLLVSKNQTLWREAADVLRFYYQHYVSFYCRNYGDFPHKMTQLYDANAKKREKTAHYLSTFVIYSEPRKWNFLEEQQITGFKNALESDKEDEVLKTIIKLKTLAEKNYDLTPFLQELELGLAHQKEEIKGKAAHALG